MGDDGFPSGVAVPDADGAGGVADEGADEDAPVVGADGFPPPDPAAWAVQPVATSATAAVARTALRMADERFMVAPRGMNCAHRDASRTPAVARAYHQVAML